MKRIIFIIFITLINFILSPGLVFAQAATLSLSPASGTFNKSCNFSLNIVLNTGSAQTDGTDAILIYDSSRFSAKTITSGTIYPDYPGNNIDEQNGRITVSGLASVSSSFSGTGTLATINFQVLDNAPSGVSQIKFDFDPADKAKTTDSNVVERGTVADILNSVTNGNYTVGSGTACAGGGTTGGGGTKGGQGASGSGTLQPTPVPTLPPAGNTELTYTLAIVGSVLTILGILGLAFL